MLTQEAKANNDAISFPIANDSSHSKRKSEFKFGQNPSPNPQPDRPVPKYGQSVTGFHA